MEENQSIEKRAVSNVGVLGGQCNVLQMTEAEMQAKQAEWAYQQERRMAIAVLNFLEFGPPNPSGYLGLTLNGGLADELRSLCVETLAKDAP